MLTAYNLTRQAWLANELEVAETFFARLAGLMGRGGLSPRTGLWIKACNSVHTFGMRFPIDLVFLNKAHQVVKTWEAVRPYRVVWPVRSATSVIELPAHSLRRSWTQVGDLLEIAPLVSETETPVEEAVKFR